VRIRRVLVITVLGYLILTAVAAVFLCDGTLHPTRRTLTSADEAQAHEMAAAHQANLKEVAIPSSDRTTLHAWLLTPNQPNTKAVILLHGLSDNRVGMTGYAELLLNHHYTILQPDARAHGASEGSIATYGLLERHDIRDWFEWLSCNLHPACIYALGESMGAAQLLQAVAVEPNFCAIVAESPFSNLDEIACDRAGQFFHSGPWLGRTLFRLAIELGFDYGRWKYGLDLRQVSPEKAAAGTQVPILLIHGVDDSNIPVRHSRRIAARNSKIVLWEVPHTDHCGAISTSNGEFENRVIAWFETHTKP
jgi:dipeptidyl aminopeptidase/acylaminoacyl peptidase